jgi:hypothetical protein
MYIHSVSIYDSTYASTDIHIVSTYDITYIHVSTYTHICMIVLLYIPGPTPARAGTRHWAEGYIDGEGDEAEFASVHGVVE